MNDLGRLERVDVRDIWKHEATDFTPWLAQDENIKLLGDTIGLDLEVQSVEKPVGPFRADILCKDTAEDNWVLVENQLERTDHLHLGQLMTYAAGLHAVKIVWIAPRFTDEHRAALDWLNEITGEDFSFFGLEIELWRIEDSPIAPKFNVVCKPNDWSLTVSGAARVIASGDLSETRSIQLEYWQRLREMLQDREGPIRPTKPQAKNWIMYSVGGKDCRLVSFIHIKEKYIRVQLLIGGTNAKPHFHLLKERRQGIEAQLGESLEWKENPSKTESHLNLYLRDCNPADKDAWDKQHLWFCEKLEAFHRVFAPIIETLHASEYEEEEVEDDD